MIDLYILESKRETSCNSTNYRAIKIKIVQFLINLWLMAFMCICLYDKKYTLRYRRTRSIVLKESWGWGGGGGGGGYHSIPAP